MQNRKSDIRILDTNYYFRKKDDNSYRVVGPAYMEINNSNEVKNLILDGCQVKQGDKFSIGTIKDIYYKKGTGVLVLV